MEKFFLLFKKKIPEETILLGMMNGLFNLETNDKDNFEINKTKRKRNEFIDTVDNIKEDSLTFEFNKWHCSSIIITLTNESRRIFKKTQIS